MFKEAAICCENTRTRTAQKIPEPGNRLVSATSLSLNVAKVTSSLVKCCPNPIFTYLSPCGLRHTHSLKSP